MTDQRRPLGTTEWLICILAAIGFLFDTYELLMAPLVARPAISELLQLDQKSKEFAATFELWNGILFYVPTLIGGLFGLVGGYLTDLYGRRKVLVWSIGLYAVSAFLAGFSTSIYMLLFLRCTTLIGVCVEFVAAVAWLSELFPDPHQREKVLGYTQVFGSLGGLLVAFVNHSLGSLVAPADVWKYTLMSGLIPAIPLMVIRPFLPESPSWLKKKTEGTLKRPGIGQLFSPELRRGSIVTCIMFACTLGIAFGAIQQGPGMMRNHPQLKDKTPQEKGAAASKLQEVQEIGGLAGRLVIAVLLTFIASRRTVLLMFLIPGAIVTPWVYLLVGQGKLELFSWAVFLPGFFTVAQLSFWGNYLPTIYPVHLRGTGESLAANVGGRMIGASGAMFFSFLAPVLGTGVVGQSKAAAVVSGTCYAIALVACFFLVQPKANIDQA